MLKKYLSGHGFKSMLAYNGLEMDKHLSSDRFHLILLDLMLPGEHGLSIARRIGSSSQLPIIFMSALGEETDRIIGLELGADDYISKPFNPRELLARIRAVLRRLNQIQQNTTSDQSVYFGPYRLDLNACQLYKGDVEINLTSGEFTLLKIFAKNPNRVLSRDELCTLTEGYERIPFDRSIDVRITRLRRKIEQDVSNPKFIRTIWGTGYLFSNKAEEIE